MRDDIHKNAPVREAWKRVIRLANEDRVDEATKAATIALSLDGKREVSDAFLGAAEAIDASPSLFGDVDVSSAEGLTAQPIQAGALERMREGANRRDAIEAELRERGQRELSHVAIYLQEQDSPGAGALIRRLRQVVSAADVAQAADNVVERRKVGYRRTPVSSDEDLR